MKKIEKYTNQKVLVLGLAKSGVSAAKLLHELGAFVTVNDFKKFDENPEAQDLLKLGIRVITGSHPVELLDEDFALLVKNPGIPYSNPIIIKALEKKIPIITEVELAYEIAESPMIGITGTNGKTTTTTMIADILNENRKEGKALLAGNIGFPASYVAQKATSEDEMVVELSSFQLLGIKTFHPEIAVITNLYEAHLDYHGSREEYVKAKWNIQKNMDASDYLVANWNQTEIQDLCHSSKAKIVPFSTQEILETGVYVNAGNIYYDQELIMAISEIGVPGEHNVENALAAIAVAKIKGVNNTYIKTALMHFSGVAHRTQFVGEIKQRKFYNDSKATNILATEKALSGFSNESVILLAGGLDRGNSFDSLIPAIKGLKGIVLFGETKKTLAVSAEKAGIQNIYVTENVETAVPLAFSFSNIGDTIILSPACASWDQYINFEVRGERFIEAVKKLKK